MRGKSGLDLEPALLFALGTSTSYGKAEETMLIEVDVCVLSYNLN